MTRLRTQVFDRSRRGQGGYTLLELILVIGISLLIIGPVSAWMLLVMREQPSQRDGMIATARADLLRGVFPEDVAVAGAADDYQGAQPSGGVWDTWRQECIGAVGSSGRRLAVLLTQDADPIKVIYSVAPSRDDGQIVAGSSSIWRTECFANTGLLRSEHELVQHVVDDPARTVATCSSSVLANGDPDSPCRQLRLAVVTDSPRPIELSATRRTDARSLVVDTTGNFLPVAKIDVTAQEWLDRGNHDTRIALSGSGSSDPDAVSGGPALTYRWEVPTGPEGSGAPVDSSRTGVTTEVVLSTPGDYWIRLTVTDIKGASNTTYRRVTVANRNPIIGVSITPRTATAGVDTLQMDGSASRDPDGAITGWAWSLTSASDPAQRATFATPTASFPVPTWAIGGLVVELTVTDSNGATAVATSFVEVLDPLAPPPDPDPDPDPDPEPVPGAPVASVVVNLGSGASVTLDASASQGTITSWAWDLGLLAGTATGPVVSTDYPGPGTYTARLTLVDDQARVGRWTGEVVIPGAMSAPSGVRTAGNALVWDPRPGARRYLVDLESTSNGCARSLLNQIVAPSLSPSKDLPPALCTGTGTRTMARVGVEGSVGGDVAWSGWIDVTSAVPA